MKRRIEKILFRRRMLLTCGFDPSLQQLVERRIESSIISPERVKILVVTPTLFSKRSKVVAEETHSGDPEDEVKEIRSRAKKAWEKKGAQRKGDFTPAELQLAQIKINYDRPNQWGVVDLQDRSYVCAACSGDPEARKINTPSVARTMATVTPHWLRNTIEVLKVDRKKTAARILVPQGSDPVPHAGISSIHCVARMEDHLTGFRW